MDMFRDTSIRGFKIILNIIKVNKYFVGILNLCIVLPTQYTKFKCAKNKNDFTVFV